MTALTGWWTVVVLLFLYLPILVLIVYSFNASEKDVKFTGLTTKWYVELFRNDTQKLIEPLKNSLIIATITTAVASVLGTSGAWLLHQYKFRLERALGTLLLVPMIVPEVIMGVSFLIFFKNIGLGDGFIRTTIAHITFCFPFVMVAVQARLSGLDPSLMEAAQDLGAPPARAFMKVIVPYLLPAIISGALMSFTLSMDELVVSWFTYDADSRTLPIRVYELARRGPKPELNVISAIFVAGTIVLVVVSQMLRRKT